MSHDVTSNVLWYFGQSLVYVATVFGFALTFDTRVKDIINKYFNNKMARKIKKISFIVQQADSHGLSMPCSRSLETKAGIIQATIGS